MGIGYWLLRPWRHAFDFSGRSPRREYWLFVAQTYALLFAAALAGGVTADLGVPPTGIGNAFMIVAVLVMLAGIVPGLAVAVRRLHDQDKSGFALFLGFIPLIGGFIIIFLMCTAGDEEENIYGPNPLDPHAMAEISEVFD